MMTKNGKQAFRFLVVCVIPQIRDPKLPEGLLLQRVYSRKLKCVRELVHIWLATHWGIGFSFQYQYWSVYQFVGYRIPISTGINPTTALCDFVSML